MISEKALSKILHDADPMGTCCNVNKGMEDEYDAEARLTISYMTELGHQFKDALPRAFDYMFFDGCLSADEVKTITEAYEKLPLDA